MGTPGDPTNGLYRPLYMKVGCGQKSHRLWDNRNVTDFMNKSIQMFMNTREHPWTKWKYMVFTDVHGQIAASWTNRRWTFMNIHEHRWTPMNTGEHPWTQREHSWTFMNTCEHPWTPVNTHEHLWTTTTNSHEYRWIPVNTGEHPWTTTANTPWTPMNNNRKHAVNTHEQQPQTSHEQQPQTSHEHSWTTTANMPWTATTNNNRKHPTNTHELIRPSGGTPGSSMNNYHEHSLILIILWMLCYYAIKACYNFFGKFLQEQNIDSDTHSSTASTEAR